jgi:hypothetical protein
MFVADFLIAYFNDTPPVIPACAGMTVEYLKRANHIPKAGH